MQQVVEYSLESPLSTKSLIQVYDDGVRALQEVVQYSECKFWDDKALALEAWAKIYHDNQILRKAKILRLRAFAAMGRLAEREQPGTRSTKGVNTPPGPNAWLKSKGMKRREISAARQAAKLTEEQFRDLEKLPTIPTPNTLETKFRVRKLDYPLSVLCGASNVMHDVNGLIHNLIPEDRLFVHTRLTRLRTFIDEVLDRLEQVSEK